MLQRVCDEMRRHRVGYEFRLFDIFVDIYVDIAIDASVLPAVILLRKKSYKIILAKAIENRVLLVDQKLIFLDFNRNRAVKDP